MTVEEQLRSIINDKYGNSRQLCKKVNIATSTLYTIYHRGLINSNVESVIKIFDEIGLDVNSIRTGKLKFLIQDELKEEEIALLNDYRVLPTDKKFLVMQLIKELNK